jgi:hypothetical protein
MILAAAVAVGLVAGLVRAWLGNRSFQIVMLRLPGLVLFAFLPQWVAFYQSRTELRVPDAWAPVLLVGSQLILLGFVWVNRSKPGFWLLGGGLALNLLVIGANGGLMPISPETVRKVYPGVPEDWWGVGERLGNGKDVVLLPSTTHFWFLSDRFLLPDWMQYQVAFSLGDVLIALGAFWLLWTLGGPQAAQAERTEGKSR